MRTEAACDENIFPLLYACDDCALAINLLNTFWIASHSMRILLLANTIDKISSRNKLTESPLAALYANHSNKFVVEMSGFSQYRDVALALMAGTTHLDKNLLV
jgi:hypothetical protein